METSNVQETIEQLKKLIPADCTIEIIHESQHSVYLEVYDANRKRIGQVTLIKVSPYPVP